MGVCSLGDAERYMQIIFGINNRYRSSRSHLITCPDKIILTRTYCHETVKHPVILALIFHLVTPELILLLPKSLVYETYFNHQDYRPAVWHRCAPLMVLQCSKLQGWRERQNAGQILSAIPDSGIFSLLFMILP